MGNTAPVDLRSSREGGLSHLGSSPEFPTYINPKNLLILPLGLPKEVDSRPAWALVSGLSGK